MSLCRWFALRRASFLAATIVALAMVLISRAGAWAEDVSEVDARLGESPFSELLTQPVDKLFVKRSMLGLDLNETDLAELFVAYRNEKDQERLEELRKKLEPLLRADVRLGPYWQRVITSRRASTAVSMLESRIEIIQVDDQECHFLRPLRVETHSFPVLSRLLGSEPISNWYEYLTLVAGNRPTSLGAQVNTDYLRCPVGALATSEAYFLLEPNGRVDIVDRVSGNDSYRRRVLYGHVDFKAHTKSPAHFLLGARVNSAGLPEIIVETTRDDGAHVVETIVLPWNDLKAHAKPLPPVMPRYCLLGLRPQGDEVVYDTSSHELKVFSSTGELIQQKRLGSPESIAIVHLGSLLEVDAWQQFDLLFDSEELLLPPDPRYGKLELEQLEQLAWQGAVQYASDGKQERMGVINFDTGRLHIQPLEDGPLQEVPTEQRLLDYGMAFAEGQLLVFTCEGIFTEDELTHATFALYRLHEAQWTKLEDWHKPIDIKHVKKGSSQSVAGLCPNFAVTQLGDRAVLCFATAIHYVTRPTEERGTRLYSPDGTYRNLPKDRDHAQP